MKLPQALLDAFAEPVLVLSSSAQLLAANVAAMRHLGAVPGTPLVDLTAALGPDVVHWLHQALGAQESLSQPPAWASTAVPVLARQSPEQWWLVLPAGWRQVALLPPPVPAPTHAPLHDPQALQSGCVAPVSVLPSPPAWHALLWSAPIAVMLQDEQYRLIDANAAFTQLMGESVARWQGRDPLQATLRGMAPLGQPSFPEVMVQDVEGRVRWVRLARVPTTGDQGQVWWLTLLLETTSEHVAREQAERFSRELGQWFDLSPMGMALFDEQGLVLRTNQVFEHLAGGPLAELREATPALQALLRWHGSEGAVLATHGAPSGMTSGDAWVSSEGALPAASGEDRWVRVLWRRYETRAGRHRYMCMLEDRTAQEERDLARLQLGALVNTAGVGLSIYAPVEPGVGMPSVSEGPVLMSGPAVPPQHATVRPTSQDAVGRLQRAMQRGERCEVRYAIETSQGDVRWLMTRVEPGRLASGRPITSVVSVDVSEQQHAQERAEQLLDDLSTILENSPAGIASLRGTTLLRCNQRFEHMLGLPAGSAAGQEIDVLLLGGAQPWRGQVPAPGVVSLQHWRQQGGEVDTEIEVSTQPDLPGAASSHWYAVTIRPTGARASNALEASSSSETQSIVVLSEITRLKTQQAELERLAAERERMAQVLGQQADRTRAVLDSVLVGIVTVDHQGCMSWLNRSARRMFGGDLGDFLGRSLETVATAEEQHPFRHAVPWFARLQDGEALRFECRVQARDGRTFWVVGNAVSTLSAQGEREMTYALMDIDQRRQAEARIAQARASLQRIIEAAPMAIAVCQARSLTVVQLNRAAAELGQVDATWAVGRSLEQLCPSGLLSRLRADVDAALLQPESATPREYCFERVPGRSEVWEARFLPLARGPEQDDHILMVATDVTAQRAAQRAELEAAIAQREMLVQEVHHRIKNNLQGVAGLMQQVAMRHPAVQPIIAEVVGQIQAIAQVYGLQVGATGRRLAVQAVVEAICQSVQRTFGRTIDVVVQGQPWGWVLPESESIPIALSLNELLTNAIKHSPAGSSVRCVLSLQPQQVVLEISNLGQLPPGFQLEQRPATVSGLGLVRSLLPRRHASWHLAQQGSRVVSQLTLSAPVVHLESVLAVLD